MTDLAPTGTGGRFRTVAVLGVVVLVAGFLIGTWRAGVRIETGTAHSAGYGGGSIVTDGWTYGFSSGVAWTDSVHVFHPEGPPECLPPLSIVEDLRFGWVDVSLHEGTWRQVVWVDCSSLPVDVKRE